MKKFQKFKAIITLRNLGTSFASLLLSFSSLSFTFSLLLLSLTSCLQQETHAQESLPLESTISVEQNGNEYYADRILIGYSDEEKINSILNLLNGKLVVHIPEIKVISVRIENAGETLQLLENEMVKRKYGIRYAEYVYVRKLVPFDITDITARADEFETKGFVPKLSGYTNYSGESLDLYLWGLRAIKIKDAWNNGYKGEGIIIAVLDTGVDGTHPDLQGQVVEGYRPSTDEILPEGIDSSFGGSHGTHVAGTIAAKSDGKGIAGVAPGAKIMPVVLFDNGGWYVGDDYAAKGIIWAVNNGANVLSNSWGGAGYSQTLKDAFDYALERGVVVVAAAGNSKSIQSYQYPANYPGVIQVSAVEFNGGDYIVADFSSGSPMISVCAPGVSIISTMPQEGSRGYDRRSFVLAENNGYYGYMTGTSMATPHVSGLVALLLQKYPNAKPWQIRKMLEETAFDIGTEGYDEKAGFGLINASAVNKNLPVDGGLDYHITVTDAYGKWNIPSVSVSLIGVARNGRNVRYFAKTNAEGSAKFIGIDTGDYNVIVSGPDSKENSEGLMRIAHRKAEERTLTFHQTLNENKSDIVRFSSQAFLEIDIPEVAVNPQIVFVDVTKLPTETGYEITKDLASNTVDFSELSGRYLIKLRLSQKAYESISVSGTLTINGTHISVGGKILKDATETYIYDNKGPYAWWTLFGKLE
ncbi:S8 family serine peptidase [Fervidobacterium pennivorans subsp. carthaginiensis]|uniref:S8 family peptidase n=1 Tax=Fervidobacterium pennivorans TaxID=93466 RepID=UPI00355B9D15